MKKIVMIAGACDPVGIRIVKDFLKMDYLVAVGLPTGEQKPDFPENVFCIFIDPFCQQSVNNAAKAVEEKFGWIDLLVTNFDNCMEDDEATIFDALDYDKMKNAYEYNSLGPLRTISAFLPLLEKGNGKRICIVTSEDSSNNNCREYTNFARHISKAPLNMAINQMFNGLRPNGFTFRMYCKKTCALPAQAGAYAVEYFTRNRSNEPESYKHSDENRLVLRNWKNIEIPW